MLRGSDEVRVRYCQFCVQELRASMNKNILQAERQIESSYVSAKAAAQKKYTDAKSEL